MEAGSVNLALAALDSFYAQLGLGRPVVRREDLPPRAPRALSEEQQRRLLRMCERASARDERDGDLARAETLMAGSLVRCRRSKAPVEIANALLHLARVHREQGLDVVAHDEIEEAAMLVKSCPDPGQRIQRLTARARARSQVAVACSACWPATLPSVRSATSCTCR